MPLADPAQIKFAILNINTFLTSITFFLLLVPIYSYALFLPTIIHALGYDDIVAQLFTVGILLLYSSLRCQLLTVRYTTTQVPPNFLAFLTVLGVAFLSDKIKMRGPLIVSGLLIAAIGYIMQLASNSNAVKYVGTFFIAVGAFPTSPLMTAWLGMSRCRR